MISVYLDCLYDGKEYQDGEMFNPAFNPCLNCSCEVRKSFLI